MAIEPIKIPQNVYIEDRIVGPLTLKQILIVAVGCGFSYALYSLMLKSYGQLPIPLTVMAWVPGALSFVFAFIKINDLSLFHIILLSLERVNKPATRAWAPRTGLTINIRTFTTVDNDHKKKASANGAQKNTDSIDALSSLLDMSMPSLVPETAGGEPAPLSPMAEQPENVTEPIGMPQPVNPQRIQASPMNGQSTDTVSPPTTGSVSIFRDLSPART